MVYSFSKVGHFFRSYAIPHVNLNNFYKKKYKLYKSAIEDFFLCSWRGIKENKKQAPPWNKGRGSRTSLAPLCGPSGRSLIRDPRPLFFSLFFSQANFFALRAKPIFSRCARRHFFFALRVKPLFLRYARIFLFHFWLTFFDLYCLSKKHYLL